MSKTIGEWQREVHRLAVEKGWHERPMRDATGEVIVDAVASKLALVHSEVSEALEALRTASPLGPAMPLDLGTSAQPGVDGKAGKPEGFEVELADAVIRILDLAQALGLDIESAIEWKHSYNASRPHRHGGKAL